MSQPPEMTTAEILGSESFRLLNTLIDEAVGEVQGYDRMIQDTCRRIAGLNPENPSHTQELRARTYEEQQAGAENPSTLDLGIQIKNLAEMQNLRENLVKRIGELQVAKLRLLNDYDFTRGDDSFQRAILAPEVPA